MSTNNWWANKLTGQPPSYPPVQQPVYQTPALHQYEPPVPPQPPVQPPASASASRCPGCGSGNYGGSTPESRPRCYDCGYPITQSGTGVKGINQGQTSGPAQAAKQIATGGWNPTTIIGKLE